MRRHATDNKWDWAEIIKLCIVQGVVTTLIVVVGFSVAMWIFASNFDETEAATIGMGGGIAALAHLLKAWKGSA